MKPEIAPIIEDEIDIEHTAKIIAEKSAELHRWALQIIDELRESERTAVNKSIRIGHDDVYKFAKKRSDEMAKGIER